MGRSRDIADMLGKTELANTDNEHLITTFDGVDSAYVSSKITPALVFYSTLDSLPVTSLTSGQQAYVNANSRLYISDGSGWYQKAFITLSPTMTLDPTGTITLATDGVTTSTVTIIANDSDTPGSSLTYSVESDGNGIGKYVISQDSSVFTIRPLSEDSGATDGTFTLTFKTSDGVNLATDSANFSLTFAIIDGLSDFDPDWGSGASIPAYDTVDNRVMESDGSTTQFGNDFSMSRDGNYIGCGTRTTKSYSEEVIAKWDGSSWAASEQFVSTANTAENDRTALANTDGAYGAGNKHFDDEGNYYIVPYGSANVGSNTDVGYLHVHARSGDTWSQQQIINVASPTSTRWSALGSSINGDGDYIAYSDWWKANGANARVGAVEIWNRSGSTWSRQTTITSTNTAQRRFGCSTAFNKDGTYLAITFPFSAYFDGYGGVEIWTRSGSTWSKQATLTPSDVNHRWEPGRTVDISDDGDVVMIGSSIYDTHGAAFVWTRSGSTWTQRQKFTIADTGASASSDRFGSAVSMSGDGKTIVISAIFGDSPSSNDGGVYVYQSTDLVTWTYQRNLTNDTAMLNSGSYRVPITRNGGKIAFMSFNTNSGADFGGTIYLADLTK